MSINDLVMFIIKIYSNALDKSIVAKAHFFIALYIIASTYDFTLSLGTIVKNTHKIVIIVIQICS